MRAEEIMQDIERNADRIARAAQEVYDDWIQIDGYSEEYGTGGICDDVAADMAEVLMRMGYDAFTLYNEYETHTAAYVAEHDTRTLIRVDIHPSNYEEGYGYTWRKIDGVRLSSRDVGVEDYSDYYDELL